MKALVIGGTGFVGVAACKELMRRGVETVAASRKPHAYGTFTSHVALDRGDRAALKRVLDEVEPDVLLDLAGYQPREVHDVLDVFRGQRYVFVSTGSVYSTGEPRPAREDDFRALEGEPPRDELDYADGKRWCETVLARNREVPWVVVRPPAVFGPNDHTLRIAAYLQRIEDGGPLLVPEETYERRAGLAWSKDMGFACALACDLKKPVEHQVFNAAFEDVTLRRMIEGFAGAMGKRADLLPIPFAEMPPEASPYGPDPGRFAGMDIERAKKDIAFEPSPLEDALAETLAWYRVARPSHPGYTQRQQELEIARARA